MTKQQRIMDYFINHPQADVKHVAKRFDAAMTTIYSLRKRAAQQAPKPAPAPVVQEAPQEIRTVSEKPKARDVQVGGDHYKMLGVEPWDVVDTWSHEQRVGFYRGNAVKYLMRMGSKDETPIEAAKGMHYLEKLIEVLTENKD